MFFLLLDNYSSSIFVPFPLISTVKPELEFIHYMQTYSDIRQLKRSNLIRFFPGAVRDVRRYHYHPASPELESIFIRLSSAVNDRRLHGGWRVNRGYLHRRSAVGYHDRRSYCTVSCW